MSISLSSEILIFWCSIAESIDLSREFKALVNSSSFFSILNKRYKLTAIGNPTLLISITNWSYMEFTNPLSREPKSTIWCESLTQMKYESELHFLYSNFNYALQVFSAVFFIALSLVYLTEL